MGSQSLPRTHTICWTSTAPVTLPTSSYLLWKLVHCLQFVCPGIWPSSESLSCTFCMKSPPPPHTLRGFRVDAVTPRFLPAEASLRFRPKSTNALQSLLFWKPTLGRPQTPQTQQMWMWIYNIWWQIYSSARLVLVTKSLIFFPSCSVSI